MTKLTVYPVIMAGGMGTRLWPVSQSSRPKQFQRITSDKTMLQETALRMVGTVDDVTFAAPSVIGGQAFEAHIAEDLGEIGLAPDKIILEPFGRNTAAVAAISALMIEDPDALVLLLPSDHHMADPDGFRAAIAAAAPVAAQGKITTFGISARSAHTGYGYIRQGEQISGNVREFDTFVEKPDRETAQSYLDDGRYTWNAGIFLYPVKTMLADLQAHAPDILAESKKAYDAARIDGPSVHLDAAAFEKVRSDSIDYAVMEKTTNGAVYAPLECGWDDIGSWTAVAALSAADSNPDPMVIEVDTKGCHVQSDGKILVTAVGVEDLVIVAHDNIVLVSHKDHAQGVKAVVEELRSAGMTDFI
jgi:mannose-1-phosphate guanylyltransferase/mannose-6-phosphate isomerase